MGFLDKLRNSLRRTREGAELSPGSGRIDADWYDRLEEQLIMADAGVDTATAIVEQLRQRVKTGRMTDRAEARAALIDICSELLEADRPLDLSGSPAVIMLIGVNGAGKTTTCGKLASLYKAEGKSVVLAAADTFRAAAVEQLKVWGERSGCPVLGGATDPAAVIYDAVSSARARGADLVIADTAGRLHNKKNLMDELAKMSRTIKKAAPEASVETLLVLDAVTGQNAINQAAMFSDSAGVSGIVLTKLDGTAKGGSVMAIKRRLGIPVRFIGVGEGMDDLAFFDPRQFCEALFEQ